jgi:hypothetical protein
MTSALLRKKIRFLLAVALLLPITGWLVMEARQWLFRARAEALLSDIKSLELNHSSWSDAQTLMTRWGKWGSWYRNCNSEDCDYTILIGHLPQVYPDFVFVEGPHLGARALQLVGLRSAGVTARLRVSHGLVTRKGFGMSVALPVSKWITPGGDLWLREKNGSSYWPTLDVAFQEKAKPDSTPDQFAEHPNRGFIQRRILLEASFSPQESPDEQAALTDFHFDCITRWRPCTNRSEILPRAVEEFEAEGRK